MLKNISLERNTKQIETKVDNIIADRQLNEILNNFKMNMERIDDKFKIVDELMKKNMEMAAKDILRSQIVLIMGAIDFYIHEIVKYGIVKIFKKEREKTRRYKSFLVNIECVEKALENIEAIDWLEEGIVIQSGKQTYMSERKIDNALKMVSEKKILDNVIQEISKECNLDKKTISKKFEDLYRRRNLIVHQTDRDLLTGNLKDILESDVQEYFQLTKKLIENIQRKIIEDI